MADINSASVMFPPSKFLSLFWHEVKARMVIANNPNIESLMILFIVCYGKEVSKQKDEVKVVIF